MRVFEVVSEGYKILPPMDKEKYGERKGLEGPFMTLSGKVVYYDPKEGSYYDPDTDMYLSYDEWRALDEPTLQQEMCSYHKRKKTKESTINEFRRVPPVHNAMSHISSAAAEFNVDPSLAYAIADKESGGTFDNRLIGDRNLRNKAYGAFQVRLPALKDFNDTYGTEYSMKDLADPAVNARVGVGYLALQRDRYGAKDSVEMAAMYNGGPQAVERQNKNAMAYATDIVKNRISRYSDDFDASTIPDTTAQSPSLIGKPEPVVQPTINQTDAETGRLQSYRKVEPTAAPTTSLRPQARPTQQSYTIQRGDNLTKIARRMGTTIDAIMRANPQIKDPNKIYAGKSLVIPEAKTKQRLDPKCWDGYKIGNPKTKMKGGVRVNNCVPK